MLKASRFLPFLDWFKGYSRADLRADFTAGLTVALVLVPQSMGYAQLAGLPAYYGLYASFLPTVIAALFGSSRQLATGPVAIVSLMTAAALEPVAVQGSQAYMAYALLLALLVGIVQLSLGVLRLGVVVNFLSHPVVMGFTNAAAIIIATSQMPKLFGVEVEGGKHYYETVWWTLVAASRTPHWPTLAMGVSAFIFMIVLKRTVPRFPAVLVVVAGAILISWAAGFEKTVKSDLSAIESPRALELVKAFNEDLRDIEIMSEARLLLSGPVEKVQRASGDLCTSCHASHPVDLDMLRSGRRGAGGEVPPEKSLQLHSMAGLLDKQIISLKEEAAKARSALREMSFDAVESREGALRFLPSGGGDPGRRVGGEVWRMRVGNRPIAPGSVLMAGGGAVVGSIPKGLPKPSLPAWDPSTAGKLLLPAMIISLLGFMEAISISKAMATRTGQRLNPSQELIGQGLANIAASLSQGYAVSGSFSRSAVNLQARAVSGMSSVFTGGVVLLVLLFLTPLLYHLPQSVLAAIIMVAVVGLVNFKGIVHSWRVQRSDGAVSVITFAATLAFAPHLDKGILLGVLLSVGVFLYQKMKPTITELSRWRDGQLRSARRFRLKMCKHIAMIRFEGPLFFANTSYLEDEVLARLKAMPDLRCFLLVSNGVNELDSSGEEALALLVGRLRAAGYDIFFSGVSENVMDVLHRSHLYEKIGGSHIFPTMALALDALWGKAHEGSDEQDCPLTKVVYADGPETARELRALVVDEDQEAVNRITGWLKRSDIVATWARNSAAALRFMDREQYDIVLLDISRSWSVGREALSELRNSKPDQSVLLLAGPEVHEDISTATSMGGVDVLIEPFGPGELLDKIQATMKKPKIQ
jgi:MFS superfamily sulfate permease-like transporter